MARKQALNPVKGGMRRRRTRVPTSEAKGTDSSVIKYSSLGGTISTASALGTAAAARLYAPGNGVGLANDVGANIVSYYSTGRFLPGTTIRWEPSVSFSTSGRVYVGFTDNPEVIRIIYAAMNTYLTTPTAAAYATYANAVKGLGSMRSFPVWQETQLEIPSKLRRKRFDTNDVLDVIDENVIDRSVQVAAFYALDGLQTGSTVATGSFWYHDVVDVEGVHSTLT